MIYAKSQGILTKKCAFLLQRTRQSKELKTKNNSVKKLCVQKLHVVVENGRGAGKSKGGLNRID